MEGSPLSRFPPINASSPPSTSTDAAIGKRKSTLLTFLRRPSAEGNTIAVPQRQSVFHDMERQPQKPLRQEELLNAVGEEKDVDPNLPTVRLVPPDGENMIHFAYTMLTDEQPDEGEPMMLYPFPLSPPPSLDIQSPPQRRTPPFTPSTPSPMPRRPPLATSNRSRPTSTYASNPVWNGMADGFVLPPPRFSRSGAGFNPRGRTSVVMPKTKTQVVEEKRRRMSAMMEWEMGYGGAERLAMNRPMSLGQEMKPPNVLEAEEERAAMANVGSQPGPAKQDEEEKIEELSEEPATSTPSAPTAPGPPTVAVKTESPVTSQSPAQLSKHNPPQPSASKPPRRSRTLSLSAAFSTPLFTKNESPATTSAPPIPPVPPVPREQTKRAPKKQKSLKNLFFSSSTPPEATLGPSKFDNFSPVAETKPVLKDKTERPKEKKPMLSKPRSKPSLHIDIDATKASSSLKSAPAASSSFKTSATPITPALSSGRSEKSNSIPATPSTASIDTKTPASASSTASKPKLNKRFSLSNMAVFKKRSNSAPSVEHKSLADMASGNGKEEVPRVPELPKAYKKEKEARRTMSEMLPAKEEVAAVPPPPLANGIVTSPVAETPKGPVEPNHSANISTDNSSLTHSPSDSTTTVEPTSASMSSDISDVDDDDDILNAQFMQLPSPRSPIDRDPAVSLQDFLNSAPGRKSEVVVVQEGRRSLEALVVLGPASVRPNTVSTDNRVSGSGSEASFASCDSGSTLNFGTSPQRKQSMDPSVEVRRDSASSDVSDDIEGLVTPVQDSVEMFRVQRQRQESQSEESNAGESTDSEGMRPMGRCDPSRKMRTTVHPLDSSSTSKSAPTRALPAPPASMSFEKKKLGSLHFDNLGLNFGEWDGRREEVSVRT